MRMIESGFKTARGENQESKRELMLKTKRFQEELQETLSRNTKLDDDPIDYEHMEAQNRQMHLN